MTVAELISELENYGGHIEVMLLCDETAYFITVKDDILANDRLLIAVDEDD
jgi:hypothetical protein